MNTHFLPERRLRTLIVSCLLGLAFTAGCDEVAEDNFGDDIEQDFRIVGGQTDQDDPAVPFLLIYSDVDQPPASVCTGSLIDSRFILTAAHCVDSVSLGAEIAAIGVYFGTEAADNDPGFLFWTEAVSATMHEGWDGNAGADQGNDIALIEVKDDVPLQPIPIMREPLSAAQIDQPVRLVGWGITQGGGDDSGLKRYADSQLFDFDDQFVLVGGPQTNTCSGDSGGPAIMNIDGQQRIVGVTSFGDQWCQEIGVSMRVDAFVGWIDNVMSGAPNPNPGSGTGGGLGESCQTGADCQSGLCVNDGSADFCTQPCDATAACPAGWACFGTDDPNLSVCAPDSQPPGPGPGPGSDSGDDGNPTIPGADGDGGLDGGDDDDDDGGGCSVAGTAPMPAGLALLIFAALGRRRRR